MNEHLAENAACTSDSQMREHLAQTQIVRTKGDTLSAAIHLLEQMALELGEGAGTAHWFSSGPTPASEPGRIVIQTSGGVAQIPISATKLDELANAGWQISRQPIALTHDTQRRLAELSRLAHAALRQFKDSDFGWHRTRPVGQMLWWSRDFRRWVEEDLDEVFRNVRLNLEYLAQPEQVVNLVIKQLQEATEHFQQAAVLYPSWSPANGEYEQARVTANAHVRKEMQENRKSGESKEEAKLVDSGEQKQASAARWRQLYAEQTRTHAALRAIEDQMYNHCRNAVELFMAALATAEQQS